MKVRDIMTPNVEMILPDVSLKEAAARMRDLDVGALPVADGTDIVGILTDRDICVRGVAQGLDPATGKVRDCMTRDVISCYDDQDISEAAKLMEDKQVRRLLVYTRKEQPCGILSLGDLAVHSKNEHLVWEALERVSEPSHAPGPH
jgi:CBS domain-containing protein